MSPTFCRMSFPRRALQTAFTLTPRSAWILLIRTWAPTVFDMVERRSSAASARPTHLSLGRGLRMLEVVAAAGGSATLSEAARKANLARSTAHYVMQSLVALGYLRQDRDNHAYELAAKVFMLAGRTWSAEQLAEIALPYLAVCHTIDDEAFIPGVRCLNAPAFSYTEEVVATLGAIGPRHRMTQQKLRECGPLVQRCAKELSLRLGCRTATRCRAGASTSTSEQLTERLAEIV